MIEVEVKLRIDDIDSIENKILELGFKKSTKVSESDQYYNGVDRDFRKTDEALRIRRSIGLEGNCIVADCEKCDDPDENQVCTLTYKGQKLDTVSMARQEIEIEIDNYEGMKQILMALGYKPVPVLNKIRQYYFSEELCICLDDVEGLGYYMEIEKIIDSEDNREVALLLIEETLKSLGYSMADTTTTSYLSMLMDKGDIN